MRTPTLTGLAAAMRANAAAAQEADVCTTWEAAAAMVDTHAEQTTTTDPTAVALLRVASIAERYLTADTNPDRVLELRSLLAESLNKAWDVLRPQGRPGGPLALAGAVTPGFVPPVAVDLPDGALEVAVDGAAALDINVRGRYGYNLLAHALVNLDRHDWLARPLDVEQIDPGTAARDEVILTALDWRRWFTGALEAHPAESALSAAVDALLATADPDATAPPAADQQSPTTAPLAALADCLNDDDRLATIAALLPEVEVSPTLLADLARIAQQFRGLEYDAGDRPEEVAAVIAGALAVGLVPVPSTAITPRSYRGCTPPVPPLDSAALRASANAARVVDDGQWKVDQRAPWVDPAATPYGRPGVPYGANTGHHVAPRQWPIVAEIRPWPVNVNDRARAVLDEVRRAEQDVDATAHPAEQVVDDVLAALLADVGPRLRPYLVALHAAGTNAGKADHNG